MDKNYRVKLEDWMIKTFKELTDEQLQEVADLIETKTYETAYKDYI